MSPKDKLPKLIPAVERFDDGYRHHRWSTIAGSKINTRSEWEDTPIGKTPIRITDEHPNYMAGPVYEQGPMIDALISECAREVEEERHAGTLRPFEPDEQVGCFGTKPRSFKRHWGSVRQPKPKQHYAALMYRRLRHRWQHEEMLALRAKNDANLALLLSRR